MLEWLTAGLAAIATFLLTGRVLAHAIAAERLDIPNARSSHARPTPRGGGLAIVLCSLAALLMLFAFHRISGQITLALTLGGAAIGTIGYLDDQGKASRMARLAVHVTACTGALFCFGATPSIEIGGALIRTGWIAAAMWVLAAVWATNLFNFMDGIDGIAASEAAFVALAGSLLTSSTNGNSAVVPCGLVFGATCLGFLLWNWPPAKIFMGDVGSGFLGFVIAVLALAATLEDPGAMVVWLILGAVFWIDATVTLLRRLARRERIYEAHRSHAYQWLSRRWGSHGSVTIAVLAIDVVWLLPLAWLAARYPEHATWCVFVAFVPITILALLAGAGRAEYRSR